MIALAKISRHASVSPMPPASPFFPCHAMASEARRPSFRDSAASMPQMRNSVADAAAMSLWLACLRLAAMLMIALPRLRGAFSAFHRLLADC